MTNILNNEIWILDDDPSILEVLETILTEYGYKSRCFFEQKQLRNALKKEIPSLLFIDVILNQSDGREIALSLKSDDKYSQIPIIIMSANSQFLDDSGKYKSDGILNKPFEFDDLLEKVKKYIH